LEQGFIDAYTDVECGDRNITNVTIVTSAIEEAPDTMARSLQDSTNYRSFTYIFRANGRCRGCSQNRRIFGEGAGRLLEGKVTTQRDLQDDCPCPPPSDDAFLLSFNVTITELLGNGTLVNVVGVNNNFSELEKVNCTSEVTEFEAGASLTLEGEVDTEISESELTVLETAFVDAYNEANAMNSETCDLLFLVAVEVELTSVNDTNRVRRLQSNRQYKYEVRVHGSCRGCPRNPCLFGESQGRRSLSSSIEVLPQFMQDSGRYLQTSDDCYCPLGDPELRLATKEEFQAIFNAIIQYLRNEGILTTVTSVVEVTDGEPTPATPTPQRVVPPTPPPTVEPTVPPTPAPTLSLDDQNELINCIAVIDEADGRSFDERWIQFRSQFPNRPFCLLQPNLPGNNPPGSQLSRPASWANDSSTIYSPVRRDRGLAANVSDWYDFLIWRRRKNKV